MKRIVKIFLILAIILFLNINVIYANENKYGEDLKQIESQLIDDTNADEILQEVPDNIKDILKDYNINSLDSDTILDLSPFDFIKMMFYGIMYKLKEPLSIFATILAVILLSSLLNNFENTFNKNSLGQTFQVVSILCVSGFIVTPIIEIIRQIQTLISQISSFLISFVPVFAGIITASGKPITAFAYNSVVLIVVEVISIVSKSFLIPLCSSYLALVICSCITTQIDLNNFIKTIKTILMWTLGLLMTIFVAILTIKSFVASSADTVTMRATQYLAGSFIPVVGSVISDTMAIIQGSMGVIKSTVGVFGIIVILLMFLPSIISTLLMNFAIKLSQIVSEMLGVKKVSSLLKATSFALTFIQAILITYGIMVIVSIGLMLVISSS